jgi:hypothetical protein
LNDILETAVSLLTNPLPTLPTIQGPPSNLLGEGDNGRGEVADRSLLEIVPLHVVAIPKEPFVEMIVQALVGIGHIGNAPDRRRQR